MNYSSHPDSREAQSYFQQLETLFHDNTPHVLLDGKTLRFTDIKAPLVILNFWATWCAPCLEELPSLVKLQNDYDPAKLQVIGINMNAFAEKNKSKLLSFCKEKKINFPVMLDQDEKIGDKFNISVLPTTIFFVRGEVKFFEIKPIDFQSQAFLNLIKAYLHRD